MIISAETIFNSDIYRNVVCRLQPTGEKSGCRSMGNYGQVVHPRKLDISDDVRNAVYLPDSYVYCSMSTKGIWKMKSTIGIKIAAVAAFAGCTDLKPLQADIAGLKSQVGTLSSDVAALKSDRSAANSAAAASTAAAAAASKADAAQSTANQALAAAQASQTGVNDLNEKIDRMFKRSVSK
jgi:outer membrane murein-binding lipoprotein Lpp